MEFFERIKSIDSTQLKQGLTNLAQQMDCPLPDNALSSLDQLETVGRADNVENLAKLDSDLARYANLERLQRFVSKAERLLKNEKRIMDMRKFINEMSLPDYETSLQLQVEGFGARLSPESLLSESSNIDLLTMEFERLRADYARAYVQAHNEYFREVREMQNRISITSRKVDTIDSLSEPLSIAGNRSLISRSKKVIKNLKPCRAITIDEFMQTMIPFHSCRFKPDEDKLLDIYLDLEEKIDNEFKALSQKLSAELSKRIIATTDRDDIDKVIDSLHVAKVDRLPDVLSEDLVETIKKVLQKG